MRVPAAGHATYVPSYPEGESPSVNSTTQLPVRGRAERVILPLLMSKCSGYFWLFSVIPRALAFLLGRTGLLSQGLCTCHVLWNTDNFPVSRLAPSFFSFKHYLCQRVFSDQLRATGIFSPQSLLNILNLALCTT